jgi:thioredoxin 1
MKEITVDVNNFDAEVMESDKPVLVDFWATWCGPCRMLGPIVAQIADERDDIKVCKINVDDAPQLAQQFNVMSIPTVIVFKNGEITGQSVGFVPKQKLLDLLN